MNNVVLMGRLTKDPELRFSNNGKAFASFTLAVDRGLSKEKKAEAERNGFATCDFIRIKAVGGTAEIVAKYVAKGERLLVEGSIQTGSYEKDGRTVFTTDVFANSVTFIEYAKRDNDEFNEFNEVDNYDVPF